MEKFEKFSSADFITKISKKVSSAEFIDAEFIEKNLHCWFHWKKFLRLISLKKFFSNPKPRFSRTDRSFLSSFLTRNISICFFVVVYFQRLSFSMRFFFFFFFFLIFIHQRHNTYFCIKNQYFFCKVLKIQENKKQLNSSNSHNSTKIVKILNLFIH